MDNQNNRVSFDYNLKRIDKVSLVMIWSLVVIIIAQDFIKGMDSGLSTLIRAFPVGVLATILFFINIKRFLKSLLFGLIPTLAVCLVIYMDNFSLDKHYMIMVATALIALYFNRRLVVAYGVIINVLIILLCVLQPANLLGEKDSILNFLSIFFLLNGQIIILFFMTKWGGNILDNATKHNAEVSGLLDKLKASSEIEKKQAEYQKAEVKKLMENLERLSLGDLNCDIEVGQPDEDTAELSQLFESISEKLHISVYTIKGYIKEISSVLARVSEGDLGVRIASEYRGDFTELKDSINNIVESLRSVISDISAAAEQVASGTTQISAGSQAVSQGAAEQASSIDELNNAVEDIAKATNMNAVKAADASSLTSEAKKEALSGNEKMQDLQKAMEQINSASANIGKIIKVIDEIAFQTNLLALNAAIEAARAGVHGKGFSVVAEEVRNLAQRSAGAAKETSELIEGSIEVTKTGTRMADETAESLARITEAVENAARLVEEIAQASGAQATGITEVNKGIEQMSGVVQNNSATAEQSAAAGEELSSQAEQLKAMVARFRLKADSE